MGDERVLFVCLFVRSWVGLLFNGRTTACVSEQACGFIGQWVTCLAGPWFLPILHQRVRVSGRTNATETSWVVFKGQTCSSVGPQCKSMGHKSWNTQINTKAVLLGAHDLTRLCPLIWAAHHKHASKKKGALKEDQKSFACYGVSHSGQGLKRWRTEGIKMMKVENSLW